MNVLAASREDLIPLCIEHLSYPAFTPPSVPRPSMAGRRKVYYANQYQSVREMSQRVRLSVLSLLQPDGLCEALPIGQRTDVEGGGERLAEVGERGARGEVHVRLDGGAGRARIGTHSRVWSVPRKVGSVPWSPVMNRASRGPRRATTCGSHASTPPNAARSPLDCAGGRRPDRTRRG